VSDFPSLQSMRRRGGEEIRMAVGEEVDGRCCGADAPEREDENEDECEDQCEYEGGSEVILVGCVKMRSRAGMGGRPPARGVNC
jgi:hypothetical protein